MTVERGNPGFQAAFCAALHPCFRAGIAPRQSKWSRVERPLAQPGQPAL